jgi:hypothetical protein
MAPDLPDTRASDAERERVAETLREHAAHGRLSVDELSERLDRAYAARTRGELSELVADLPSAPRPAPPRPERRQDLRGQVAAYVAVNLILIVVWAATGAGYFWPLWPILGWGIGLAPHFVPGFRGIAPCGRAHRPLTRL